MSFYTIALFAHVVGVIVMFMSTAVELLCLHRMRGAATTAQLREWASLSKTIGMLFPIGGGAMVVSGLYMAVTAWGLSVPWIGLSLAVVVAMSVFGPFVNSRRLEGIAAAMETAPSGPIAADLVRRIQDPVLLASVHTLAALAFGVVLLKVARPDLAGALAVLAVAVVAGMLSTRLAYRGGRVLAEDKPISPAAASQRL